MSELKIPFGKRVSDERMVSPTQVESGLACGCVCAACGGRLIARHSNRGLVQSNFAHEADTRNCHGGVETSIHLMAKDIIRFAKHVRLPPISLTGNLWALPSQCTEDAIFEDVGVEQRYDGYRPDIVGHYPFGCLLIEPAVTHFCDPNKIELIKRDGNAAIEIDIGYYRDKPLEELIDGVLYSARRKWLYSPDIERLREGDKERRRLKFITDEEERIRLRGENEERIRLAAERFVADQEAKRKVEAYARQQEEQQRWDSCPQLVKRIVLAWRRVSYDACPLERGWEDRLCKSIVDLSDNLFQATDIIEWLKKEGLIRPGLDGFISRENEAIAQSFEPDFITPFNAVVRRLRDEPFIRRDFKKWSIDESYLNIPQKPLHLPDDFHSALSTIPISGYVKAAFMRPCVRCCKAQWEVQPNLGWICIPCRGPVGSRVFHQKFGYGMVTFSEDDRLDVIFDKFGDKRVLSRFVEIS